MNIQQKRDFLTSFVYWAVIAAAVYLVFQYLIPISVPCILGIALAYVVVRISRRLRCSNKFFRLGLCLLIYGVMGTLLTLLVARAVATIGSIIKWVPEVYDMKLLPFLTVFYNWTMDTIQHLDPNVMNVLEMAAQSLFTSLRNMLTTLSGFVVEVLSGLATGIPSLILSLLAMIFSTVFVVNDYERIRGFASNNLPVSMKRILKLIWIYLKDTLFVVIRSYALIMLLTFTELSILFSLFGIENAVLKAALIAMLDILPILGTGGIMIPWAVISLVLGYARLGIQLLAIYSVVTVVRNYVEPKIVGTQLGLHPIITLVSMFIGLRLFGFWGLFGLPVGISFLWKQRQGNEQAQMQTDVPDHQKT